MLRIIRLDQRAVTAEITNNYNCRGLDSILQYTVPHTLLRIDLHSRWAKHVPALTVCNPQ